MNSFPARLVKNLTFLTLVGLVILGLYLASLYNFNLFHLLVEVFSIMIGFSAFIITWNSRKRISNNFLLTVGIAYLSIASLDLIHAITYKGMNIFAGIGANPATQFWIAASLIKSLTFAAAPFLLRRSLKPGILLGFYAVLTVLLIGSIAAAIFPTCYIEGEGLTPFKIGSEYFIILTLSVSAFFLLRNRADFDRQVMIWLQFSIFLTIAADLAFTLYIDVFGQMNLIGHIFRLFGVYYFYRAVVETGLNKPQRVLFRELAESENRLREALIDVERLAITDPLTGLYNRRHFFNAGTVEFQRARRYGRPLSIIMLDIDHFKRVNDSCGHQAGDEVLKELAGRLAETTRNIDILGRYGGEEFVVILPDIDQTAALAAAKRLRMLIVETSFTTHAGEVSITASLGMASISASDSSFEDLLYRADEALFTAKNTGRNQVRAWQET